MTPVHPFFNIYPGLKVSPCSVRDVRKKDEEVLEKLMFR